MTEVSIQPNTAAVAVSSPTPQSPQASVPPPPDFRQVYRQECPFVWRVVRRLGVRDTEVEDLVHDVFAAAYRSWPNLDGGRPIRPWLYGVCYRVVLDHQRKHSTTREQPFGRGGDAVALGQRGPAEAAERRQGLTLAQRLIDELELDRRAVFVLHELEELQMPQIAESLGIPLNTAYSRLRLARRDFEQAARALTQGAGGAP